MTNSNFDTWLTSQFEIGLVDIKFAIFTGKGLSASAVQAELLSAEAKIQAGFLSSPPKATSVIPENVMTAISQVCL